MAVTQVTFCVTSLLTLHQPWMAFVCVGIGCIGLILTVILLQDVLNRERSHRYIKEK